MSAITKLRRELNTGLATIRAQLKLHPISKCMGEQCKETPHWTTFVVTAMPDGHKIEAYVFCEEHYLLFTGQKQQLIVTPEQPKIIQLFKK